MNKKLLYQYNAFAEMVNGGGSKGVPTSFEGPIIVIAGDAFEIEVFDAFRAENGGEATNSGGGVGVGEVIL